MIVRAKAPLRLGLAGGGTDVNPYSDLYGGLVLNATIDYFAYTTIVPIKTGIVIRSTETGERLTFESLEKLPLNGPLPLTKAVYNRIVSDYIHKPLAFELNTALDAPPGSGLGSSSTLVVSMLAAFAKWLNLPFGEYDLARLAYEIERLDLGYEGGKQDQYAATFGGFNFMEFFKDGNVVVNPLRINPDYIHELEMNLLLYHTGTSRLSTQIIKEQQQGVIKKKEESVLAMHKLKDQALMMKEALLKGNLDKMGEILDFGWLYKKQMAKSISNTLIDEIYETAKKYGATGGKITGAGGGGFMMLYCPGTSRYQVIEAIKAKYQGEFKQYHFSETGVISWVNGRHTS